MTDNRCARIQALYDAAKAFHDCHGVINPDPEINPLSFRLGEALSALSDERAGVKHAGVKHDDGKLRWTLLPFAPLSEVVRVLEHGANKYSEDNWKNIDPSRYHNAAYRHLILYTEGEDDDSDSGYSHLAHAVCCILFMMWNHSGEIA